MSATIPAFSESDLTDDEMINSLRSVPWSAVIVFLPVVYIQVQWS